MRGLWIVFLFCHTALFSQLKFVVEDFEGFSGGEKELQKSGFFTYGMLDQAVSAAHCTGADYSGKQCLEISARGKDKFGGWGKGIGLNIELDQRYDHINFYVFSEKGNAPATFRVELQEDDNSDHNFNRAYDDAWSATHHVEGKGAWELVSIPLAKFSDDPASGDGGFNISYHHGKLCVLLFALENTADVKPGSRWYFDFISFSKGALPHGSGILDAPAAALDDFVALGAWSREGNSANFVDIASTFEKQFPIEKKLGVIHFFQSFSVSGDAASFHYPSVDRINKVIRAGYIPMITLEDHFVNVSESTLQPNLYSIVEGHFDSFLGYWAHQIKDVEGVVLLRILHEFNGDWYPWCTVKNDRNPYLVAKAFRYIVNIFRQNNVQNVRFVWCPNSMSVPQESWNFIMDAYPGDDYVDFVALDIYNGAGTGEGVDIWRSFRKEGMENYFILTDRLPGKPLLVCETASRERRAGEGGQDKARWIEEMARALKTDMSRVRLLAWFDEKRTFTVGSSKSSLEAFSKSILRDPFFVPGREKFGTLIR